VPLKPLLQIVSEGKGTLSVNFHHHCKANCRQKENKKKTKKLMIQHLGLIYHARHQTAFPVAPEIADA